ncbi:MAG: hypothetical protein V4579_08260 [Pseudomonadota bacterium]
MAKNKSFKLPKQINGFKLPKKPRKTANRMLSRAQGPELEVLVGVVLGAVVAHFVDKDGETKLSQRVKTAVGDHLMH